MPSKHSKDFDEIEAAKERLRHRSTERLRKMAGTGVLTKAAAIAVRELLAEREAKETTKL